MMPRSPYFSGLTVPLHDDEQLLLHMHTHMYSQSLPTTPLPSSSSSSFPSTTWLSVAPAAAVLLLLLKPTNNISSNSWVYTQYSDEQGRNKKKLQKNWRSDLVKKRFNDRMAFIPSEFFFLYYHSSLHSLWLPVESSFFCPFQKHVIAFPPPIILCESVCVWKVPATIPNQVRNNMRRTERLDIQWLPGVDGVEDGDDDDEYSLKDFICKSFILIRIFLLALTVWIYAVKCFPLYEKPVCRFVAVPFIDSIKQPPHDHIKTLVGMRPHSSLKWQWTWCRVCKTGKLRAQ